MANNGKIKASLILAAYVTIVSLVLTFLVTKFLGISVTQLFSIGATTGITATVGTKFLAFINRFVAFDILSIVTLYISAAIVIIAGNFLMGLGLPAGKNNWQKLALVLLYGTVPFYLLLVGMKWMGLEALVGMIIWYAVLAISVGLVQSKIRL